MVAFTCDVPPPVPPPPARSTWPLTDLVFPPSLSHRLHFHSTPLSPALLLPLTAVPAGTGTGCPAVPGPPGGGNGQGGTQSSWRVVFTS